MKELLIRAVRTALFVAGVEVHPTTWQFVCYYFFGGAEQPQLRPEDIEETRREVIWNLRNRLRDPRRNYSLVASVEPAEEWWSTLMGAVGRFNYRIVKVGPEHLLIECRDTWDFNEDGQPLYFACSSSLGELLIRLGKKVGVVSIYVDGCIVIQEPDLVILNKGHAFTTVWSFEIETSQVLPPGKTWEDIGLWDEGNYAFIKK